MLSWSSIIRYGVLPELLEIIDNVVVLVIGFMLTLISLFDNESC